MKIDPALENWTPIEAEDARDRLHQISNESIDIAGVVRHIEDLKRELLVRRRSLLALTVASAGKFAPMNWKQLYDAIIENPGDVLSWSYVAKSFFPNEMIERMDPDRVSRYEWGEYAWAFVFKFGDDDVRVFVPNYESYREYAPLLGSLDEIEKHQHKYAHGKFVVTIAKGNMAVVSTRIASGYLPSHIKDEVSAYYETKLKEPAQ